MKPHCSWLFLVLFAIWSAAPLRAAPQDPAALTCRVLSSQASDFDLQLLEVEVSNSLDMAAEPLIFEITSPKEGNTPASSERYARVQLPYWAREGRVVPAGGKQTYWALTAHKAKATSLELRVESAWFGAKVELAKPELKIGPARQVQRASFSGTHSITELPIHNPHPFELDVLLWVQWEQPKKARDLIGVRLPAASTLLCLFASRPGLRLWIDPLDVTPSGPTRVVAWELVDWSAVKDAPTDETLAQLRSAWDAWYRWPENQATCRGDFVFRHRALALNKTDSYQDFLIRGQFRLDQHGALSIEVQSGKGANPRMLLNDALSQVRRPDFDSLAKTQRLVPQSPQRVALIGPGWRLGANPNQHLAQGEQRANEFEDLEFRSGRITSSGRGMQERSRWQWQPCAGAWVVTERSSAGSVQRYAYSKLGERIVPRHVFDEQRAGDTLYQQSELELSNWSFAAGEAFVVAAPSGDGAERLRAIWDQAWRWPITPADFEADFNLQCSNDGVWRGEKKLSGSLWCRGFGPSMQASDIQFPARMAPEQARQFASMLLDRLGIWSGRDFHSTSRFDEYFAGATVLAPNASGVFRIEKGRVAEVQTQAGLVSAIVRADGSIDRYQYKTIGNRSLLTRIDQEIGGPQLSAAQRWQACVQISWQELDGNPLPTKLVFERIFGRDWGPETLSFTNWRRSTRK